MNDQTYAVTLTQIIKIKKHLSLSITIDSCHVSLGYLCHRLICHKTYQTIYVSQIDNVVYRLSCRNLILFYLDGHTLIDRLPLQIRLVLENINIQQVLILLTRQEIVRPAAATSLWVIFTLVFPEQKWIRRMFLNQFWFTNLLKQISIHAAQILAVRL